MREKPDGSPPGEGQGQRALVLLPIRGPLSGRDPAQRLEEAVGLAVALGLSVCDSRAVALRTVAPGTLFGAGRVDELGLEISEAHIDVVVVDDALSPVQQRNLERAWKTKVIDREGLILEIFGLRAFTKEGKLQVELARQGYERSRLVRTWTHLERQRGGLGKTGGPGETQIELDRRLIADRIVRLKQQLQEVRRTRGLQRARRVRTGVPSVALVGYTNAGKSTLFNRLTDAGVMAQDLLFATLDPTARQIRLPRGRIAMLSDTVGFISDLPTDLIEAFRATLEAVSEADLLIHVRDISHPETEAQRLDVLSVLAQIGAGGADQPVIEAWNKIDRVPAGEREALLVRAGLEEGVLALSAAAGEGLDALLAGIEQHLFGSLIRVEVWLDPADGRTRAWIAARGQIIAEHMAPDGRMQLTVELPQADADALAQRRDQALAAE